MVFLGAISHWFPNFLYYVPSSQMHSVPDFGAQHQERVVCSIRIGMKITSQLSRLLIFISSGNFKYNKKILKILIILSKSPFAPSPVSPVDLSASGRWHRGLSSRIKTNERKNLLCAPRLPAIALAQASRAGALRFNNNLCAL